MYVAIGSSRNNGSDSSAIVFLFSCKDECFTAGRKFEESTLLAGKIFSPKQFETKMEQQEGTEEDAFGTMSLLQDESEADTSRDEASFSVLTYNILADAYASKTIAKCSRQQPEAVESLYWSKRGALLKKFLTKMQPDILCMQEVLPPKK